MKKIMIITLFAFYLGISYLFSTGIPEYFNMKYYPGDTSNYAYSDDGIFVINDGLLSVVDKNALSESVIVPEEISGIKVTNVDFKDCTNLKTIELPNTLTII